MGICHSAKNSIEKKSTSKFNSVNGSISKDKNLDEENTKFNTKIQNKIVENEKEIVVNSSLYVSQVNGLPTENYKVIKKLGEGSYGVVLKVHHLLTSHDRAMKKIAKNPNAIKEIEQEILNEIEILRKIDHPNIVKIFEFYNTEDNYYLITEFCEHGELFQQIVEKAPFPESLCAHIMFQILSAVNYCHNS
jgi:calcium-dependent protein kinase